MRVLCIKISITHALNLQNNLAKQKDLHNRNRENEENLSSSSILHSTVNLDSNEPGKRSKDAGESVEVFTEQIRAAHLGYAERSPDFWII